MLHRVGEQVGQDVVELPGRRPHPGQSADLHGDLLGGDLGREVVEDALDDVLGPEPLARLVCGGDLEQREEVPDHVLRAAGMLRDPLDVAPGVCREPGAVSLQHEIGDQQDVVDRRLQVVRHRVDEGAKW